MVYDYQSAKAILRERRKAEILLAYCDKFDNAVSNSDWGQAKEYGNKVLALFSSSIRVAMPESDANALLAITEHIKKQLMLIAD